MMILIYFTWGSMFSLFPAIIGDYFGPDARLPITAFFIRRKASLPLVAAALPRCFSPSMEAGMFRSTGPRR